MQLLKLTLAILSLEIVLLYFSCAIELHVSVFFDEDGLGLEPYRLNGHADIGLIIRTIG